MPNVASRAHFSLPQDEARALLKALERRPMTDKETNAYERVVIKIRSALDAAENRTTTINERRP